MTKAQTTNQPAGPAKTNQHVVIIGAGIIGISTAIWLQRDGFDVTIVDPLGPGEATSHGNGGVLASVGVVPVTVPGILKKAPGMLLNPKSPLFMRWSYFPKLIPWLVRYLSHANEVGVDHTSRALTFLLQDAAEQHQALAAGTGAERYLFPGDYLYAYESKAAFEADHFAWDIRRQRGYEWEELSAEEFNAYDPAFGGTVGFAIRLKNHGRISDPGAYVKALAAHVEKQGGTFLKDKVIDFANGDESSDEKSRIRQVVCEQHILDCDHVVLAAGAWSKFLAAKLGVDLKLETERGYHIEFVNPSIVPKAPVMVASGKFVITPMDGRLRCAGIVEFGGLEIPSQEPPFELLKSQTESALPNLKYTHINRWMGHRPAPAGSIPAIGATNSYPNVHLGVGHHHVGLTGGAKTGRIISGCIRGERTNIDLSMFKPTDF